IKRAHEIARFALKDQIAHGAVRIHVHAVQVDLAVATARTAHAKERQPLLRRCGSHAVILRAPGEEDIYFSLGVSRPDFSSAINGCTISPGIAQVSTRPARLMLMPITRPCRSTSGPPHSLGFKAESCCKITA